MDLIGYTTKSRCCGLCINVEEMGTVNVDALIKENEILMKQIRENREKFWNSFATIRPKKKQIEIDV